MSAIQYPDVPFDLEKALVLLARRGSEAHGTYRPPTEPTSIDDRDLLGIVKPPLMHTLGLRVWDHAESIKGPWDVVLYDVRKFVALLVKQNPNVLSTLWVRPEDYLHVSDVGAMLIASRNLFRAKEPAFQSFIGYANGQLRRMTHTAYLGYMGTKRKQLVDRFGFDCKNGAHLIRLLRMGIEYLLTGKLNVFRHDADELVSIKRGEWPLQRVLEESEILFKRAHEAKERSTLPEAIDLNAVDDLLRRVYGQTRHAWGTSKVPT